MANLDDMTILDVARKIGFLNNSQINECLELRKETPDASLIDMLSQGGLLNPHQIRALLVAARYEQTRDEDLAISVFATSNGFLTKEAVERCLQDQEEAYVRGEPFKRLQEILLEGNHINVQQMQMILRARAQIEATRVQLLATGAAIPTKPPTRRMKTPSSMPKPAPEPAADPDAPARAPVPPPMAPSVTLNQPLITRKALIKPPPTYVEDFLKKHKDGAILSDSFKVALRRTKPGGKHDEPIVVIELFGTLDDSVERAWESYLDEAIASGNGRLILNCEELTSIATASLKALATATRNCRDRSGDLRLYNVKETIKKAIHNAELDALLRVYDSERGVVMSYRYM